MSRIASIMVLALVLTACGQTFVYEPRRSGMGTRFVLSEKRHVWKPIWRSWPVHEAIEKLPAEEFREARKWWPWIPVAAGCWRFETSNGISHEAGTSSIEFYLNDILVLWGPEWVPGSVLPEVRLDRLRWIASSDPFMMEVKEGRILVTRVEKEGQQFRIREASGQMRFESAGNGRVLPDEVRQTNPTRGWGVAPIEPTPLAPILAFDGNGHAYTFERGTEERFLNYFLAGEKVSTGRQPYLAIPMSEVRRWEFDKEWGPVGLLMQPYVAIGAVNRAHCR